MNLTKDSIKSKITSKIIGNEIIFFDEIDSTNSYLKKNCGKYMEGAVVVASSQTHGRGRRGNQWDNSPKESIFMSILLKPNDLMSISILTLIAGLAVHRAINNQLVKIKWPNDLIINEKKFCGILAELTEDCDGSKNLVLGIGINVKSKNFSDCIKDKATSLSLEGINISIPSLIGSICKEFESMYFQFIDKGFYYFVDEYKKNCITVGKEVKIIIGDKKEIGTVVDINNDGSLLFVDSKNIKRNILAGEVSVRGMNGYV